MKVSGDSVDKLYKPKSIAFYYTFPLDPFSFKEHNTNHYFNAGIMRKAESAETKSIGYAKPHKQVAFQNGAQFSSNQEKTRTKEFDTNNAKSLCSEDFYATRQASRFGFSDWSSRTMSPKCSFGF